MMKTNTKKLVIAGLCVALGVVLPLAFHAFPKAGSIFLPMHIPVLLCGLVCGWPYGLACGIMAPLLSFVLTGMPSATYLPSMLCELAAYGLVSGLLFRFIRTKKLLLDVYISLAGAMLAGRALYGVLNAFILMAGKYSMSLWLSAAFVTSLPGIVIQLALIPALVLVLRKARLIDR